MSEAPPRGGFRQGDEAVVVAARLLPQQADAQGRAGHLAGMDLAEHQGLLPVEALLALADHVADRAAGLVGVAGQQIGLDPRPLDRLVGVPLGHHAQQLLKAFDLAQGRKMLDAQLQEAVAFAGRLARRRDRGRQQKTAGQLAQRGRIDLVREPRQEAQHDAALGAPPHVAAEAAAAGIQGPDRLEVDGAETVHLDLAGGSRRFGRLDPRPLGRELRLQDLGRILGEHARAAVGQQVDRPVEGRGRLLGALLRRALGGGRRKRSQGGQAAEGGPECGREREARVQGVSAGNDHPV